MKRLSALAVALTSLAAPALGTEALWRDCRTCHAVTAPDGTEIARGGRSGPNLFGVAGSPLLVDRGFRFYSSDLRAAAATGAQWTEANFVAYLANPDQFLRATTGNTQAASGMHIEMRSGGAELFRWLRDISQ